MPAPAIAVEGLRFEYPGVRALDEVSFQVERGSVTALVGPNGAGKTTLLRCIAGLDAPMLGQVRVGGIDVLESPRDAHRRLGFLSDFYGLYDTLTVRQCLAHAAAANGVPGASLHEVVRRTAGQVGIEHKLDAPAGALSRGQRQRVAIGQAMVHAPDVLLLDEPASGLDPEARVELAGLFKQLQAEGMTLVVSSHILAELDAYSTHMLVLREGRIVDHRGLHAGATSVRRLRVALARPDPRLAALLADHPGVSGLQPEADGAVFDLAGGGADQAALLSALVSTGLAVRHFSEAAEDLQASYLRTVSGEGRRHQ